MRLDQLGSTWINSDRSEVVCLKGCSRRQTLFSYAVGVRPSGAKLTLLASGGNRSCYQGWGFETSLEAFSINFCRCFEVERPLEFGSCSWLSVLSPSHSLTCQTAPRPVFFFECSDSRLHSNYLKGRALHRQPHGSMYIQEKSWL